MVTRREAAARLQHPQAAGFEASQTLGKSGGRPEGEGLEGGAGNLLESVPQLAGCTVAGGPLKNTEYRS